MVEKQQGFTLIELMIEVAIIGILAAVAIPSYQDYTARAQLSEAFTLTSGVKTALAEYISGQNTIPAIGALGVTTVGKYVSNITISGNASNPEITARMKGSGINANLANETITLTSDDGGGSWDCSGGSIDSKYRPASCR